MRRTALLGLPLLLAGCSFVGNPLDGFGGFMSNTHTFQSNPNAPPGADETIQRVTGSPPAMPALRPEDGDVWPGPIKPIPSTQDLLRQGEMEQLPPPDVPRQPPPPLFNESPSTSTPPPPASVSTKQGAMPVYQNPNGVQTYTAPGGGTGIIVPNGNGTSTLIGPNGQVQTVPTPK
jgi:hypothetical protein